MALETGRTHQIRVHLSAEGLPIVGDDVYNGQKRAKNLKSIQLRQHILKMERFALHAQELGFMHPTKQEMMKFHCNIPEDLELLFELCGF